MKIPLLPSIQIRVYNNCISSITIHCWNFLDENFPLLKSSWKEISKIQIEEDKLVLLSGTKKNYLKNSNQFVGFNGNKDNPISILIKNNNLHLDILIDPNTTVGKIDKIGISNVVAESALSTIVDNEDSVAAVDAEDKVNCYRNCWYERRLSFYFWKEWKKNY